MTSSFPFIFKGSDLHNWADLPVRGAGSVASYQLKKITTPFCYSPYKTMTLSGEKQVSIPHNETLCVAGFEDPK